MVGENVVHKISAISIIKETGTNGGKSDNLLQKTKRNKNGSKRSPKKENIIAKLIKELKSLKREKKGKQKQKSGAPKKKKSAQNSWQRS